MMFMTIPATAINVGVLVSWKAKKTQKIKGRNERVKMLRQKSPREAAVN